MKSYLAFFLYLVTLFALEAAQVIVLSAFIVLAAVGWVCEFLAFLGCEAYEWSFYHLLVAKDWLSSKQDRLQRR